MDTQKKILLSVLVVIVLAVAVVLLQPAVEKRLALELRTACVGFEVGTSGIAEVGQVEVEAGTPVALHAILEAVGRDGQPLYYTTASRLRLWGREVEEERVRRWSGMREVKIRWFELVATPPYLEVGSAADLDRLTFARIYRADWPLEWTIPAGLTAAAMGRSDGAAAPLRPSFGTWRFHVQFELYGRGEELVPGQRIGSWEGEDLVREAERFPTLRALLPGRLAAASKVFGLTQVELADGAEAEVEDEVARLRRSGVAFSRATAVWDQIRGAGHEVARLEWHGIDLSGAARWGEPAAPGDLLRVGNRVVVLYQDRGEAGVLDYDDLCFDFDHGVAINALGEVFSGEGELVELAALGPPPDRAPQAE